MDDAAIVELYWARDEDAIVQTQQKYGPYCRTIARNILGSPEDSQKKQETNHLDNKTKRRKHTNITSHSNMNIAFPSKENLQKLLPWSESIPESCRTNRQIGRASCRERV